MCENAGLPPTPATFELDYVCAGKLSKKPTVVLANEDLPAGCSFRCRDNMTTCEDAAAQGKCDTHASVMRFQCPASCKVCKELEMELASASDYAKRRCARTFDDGSGDDPEHKANCGAWAQSGECVHNYDFMKVACPQSCGLCSPAPKRKKERKKSKAAQAKAQVEDGTVTVTGYEGGDAAASVVQSMAESTTDALQAEAPQAESQTKQEGPTKSAAASADEQAAGEQKPGFLKSVTNAFSKMAKKMTPQKKANTPDEL